PRPKVSLRATTACSSRHQRRAKGANSSSNLHQRSRGEFYRKAGTFSKLRFHFHGATIYLRVMFHNSQSQTTALFFRGKIRLENLREFLHWNSRTRISDGHNNRIILTESGGDFDLALSIHRLAGVDQNVHEHLGD